MKRWKHTLSNYRMVTGNMGELMPINCVPVLPGDTFRGSTDVLIRCSPLNTPVMHPVKVRVHHWFVPNRIIWDGWEDFITGGNDGLGEGQTIPQATLGAGKKTVTAYLGMSNTGAGKNYNALALFGFNKIYNQRYRDQDLVPERAEGDDTLPRVAWEKDYASTARPWTQRGPEVTLPLGATAPVIPDTGTDLQPSFTAAGSDVGPLIKESSNHPNSIIHAGASTGNMQWENPKLIADLANAEAPAVNDFRAAFALQRYQEARARYGARFVEYLRYLQINPSDARLQEPEYLGGGETRLSFSEVLQTSPTPDRSEPPDRQGIGVGDMFGHGIAGAKTATYQKFFEEHGYVFTLLSVRPKALYVNAMPKEFLKTTKEDYFQKELANLGQQEVYAEELHAGSTPGTVFGFQDRYHEYRTHPSMISQDFLDTLNAYHIGRDLAPDPVLNQAFVDCVPPDRIFQVGEATADTLWVMANNHIVARRMVPKRANPRII